MNRQSTRHRRFHRVAPGRGPGPAPSTHLQPGCRPGNFSTGGERFVELARFIRNDRGVARNPAGDGKGVTTMKSASGSCRQPHRIPVRLARSRLSPLPPRPSQQERPVSRFDHSTLRIGRRTAPGPGLRDLLCYPSGPGGRPGGSSSALARPAARGQNRDRGPGDPPSRPATEGHGGISEDREEAAITREPVLRTARNGKTKSRSGQVQPPTREAGR